MKKVVPYVTAIPFVLMLSCQPEAPTQEKPQPTGQANGQAADVKPAVTDYKTRVTGQLIGSHEEPQARKELSLIEVRLVDLEGKEIAKLPPKEDVILDANVNAPVATAQTDTSGRFEFKGVKPGRYSIVRRTAGGAGKANFLRSPQSDQDHLVFDLASGQAVELGKLGEVSK